MKPFLCIHSEYFIQNPRAKLNLLLFITSLSIDNESYGGQTC